MFIDEIGACYLFDFQGGASVKVSLLSKYTLGSRRKQKDPFLSHPFSTFAKPHSLRLFSKIHLLQNL